MRAHRGACSRITHCPLPSWCDFTCLEAQSFTETSKPYFVLLPPLLSGLTLPSPPASEITGNSAAWEESVFRHGSRRAFPAYIVRMTCNLSCAQILGYVSVISLSQLETKALQLMAGVHQASVICRGLRVFIKKNRGFTQTTLVSVWLPSVPGDSALPGTTLGAYGLLIKLDF